jgi:hypothetical protein
MRWTVVPPVVMGCGMILMLGGVVWPRVIPTEMVYSEEKAKELMRAGGELHSAHYAHAEAEHDATRKQPPQQPGVTIAHTHGDGEESVEQAKEKLDKAKRDYDAATAELNSARKWRSMPATILWWLGGTVVTVGVAGYFVLKTEWAQQFVEE